MKNISISEQVGCGNFAGETPEEQEYAANKYAELMEKFLLDYCKNEFPEYDVEIDFYVDDVSGCTRTLSVDVEYKIGDERDWERSKKIEEAIVFEGEQHAERIVDEIYL